MKLDETRLQRNAGICLTKPCSQVSTPVSPTPTRPSTAGRITLIITSAFLPRARTLPLAARLDISHFSRRGIRKLLNDWKPQFWLAYRSLCPSGWYERWDAQRGELRTLGTHIVEIRKQTADFQPNRGWQLPRPP